MPRRPFEYMPRPEDFYIHIGWPDDPTSIVQMPPQRLSKETIDITFHSDCAYLKDEAGDVYWPHQWQTKLNPKPYKYFIYERDPHLKLVDAFQDYNYVGSAAACIVNVPGKITVDDLRVWLRTGLIACDPRVQRLHDRLTEYQAKLVKVHKNRDLLLEDYGYIAEPGKEGDDDAVPQLIKDQPKFQKIMRVRKQLLSKVPKLKKQLHALSVGIKAMHIEMTQLHCQGKDRKVKEDPFVAKAKTVFEVNEEKEKEPDRVYTWKVELHSDDARRLIREAVKFDGWARVLLLPARSKKRPAVCRYVPLGAEELQDDPREAETMMMLLDRAMNMKEVYLINLRHGEGSCRGRYKEIYSGMWHAGFRHGNGIEMALNGRYRGEWELNVRVGKGTLELPNGDKWMGEMGTGTEGPTPEVADPKTKYWGRSLAAEPRLTPAMIATRQPLAQLRAKARPEKDLGPLAGLPTRLPYYAPAPLFTIRSEADFEPNPYVFGVPHGDGVLTFADGSTYTGHMENGVPSGFGLYKGRDGEIKEGMFLNGVLHGLGTHVLKDGTVRSGLFQNGEMARRGYEKRPDGEEYEGDFLMDARHGQGTSHNRRNGDSLYDGTWRFGEQQGLGTYTNTDKRGVGFSVFANWAADGMRTRSTFTRVRPKSMQGYRVDAAHPPMALCSSFGTLAYPEVEEHIRARQQQRLQDAKKLKYLTEKARNKVRKRLRIGSSMHHKRWIRMRRIWSRFSHDWKELTYARELAAERRAKIEKEAEELAKAIAAGARVRGRPFAGAGQGAGAGAGTDSSITGTTTQFTTTLTSYQ